MIEKINNFLEKDDFKKVVEICTSNKFPWYICDVSDGHSYKQLSHSFYKKHEPCSGYSGYILPIIKKLNPLALVRIKSNLLFKSKHILEYPPHVDSYSKKTKSAILYLNSNNGYTIIDNEKYESTANMLVKFPSNLSHYGSTCSDEEYRLLINIVYIEND